MATKDRNTHSRVSTRKIGGKPENEEETAQEVTAQITLPIDGGWGWMVVFSSFFSIFILDGVCFTFGSFQHDMTKDLGASTSMIALVNSTAISIYFLASPMASALINRYGFRVCSMMGSTICALSLLIAHVTAKYAFILFFYGFTAGLGYSLINMSAGLVVGFYFQKYRSIALAISTCGSSIGVMAMFPLNTLLVAMGGWRPTTLLHSALFGMIFFLGMAYRPLVSVTLTNAPETTDYVASVVSTKFEERKTPSSKSIHAASKSKPFFSAVSNVNFPTAANLVDLAAIKQSQTSRRQSGQTGQSGQASQSGQPSPSTSAFKLVLTPVAPDGGFSRPQMKQVHSVMSRLSEKVESTMPPESPEPVRKGILHWEPHPAASRPLYRDDAFYEGRLSNLPAYKDTEGGLEYQMAVTRATAVTDVEDQRGVLTLSMKRVLATMMDFSLLKRNSFLLMCCSGFLTYLGFLVPYVYLKDRNLKAGIDPKHCSLFISTIGLSNAIGRLMLGLLASKIEPLKLFSFGCSMAGVSTIASGISFDVYYQYFYCCVFGFFISSVVCLRSLILVSLYGLDKLTNATGMMLIFLGLGNLGSTPLAGVLIEKFGYSAAFYVSGSFITMSGLVLIPVKVFASKENSKLTPPAQPTHAAK